MIVAVGTVVRTAWPLVNSRRACGEYESLVFDGAPPLAAAARSSVPGTQSGPVDAHISRSDWIRMQFGWLDPGYMAGVQKATGLGHGYKSVDPGYTIDGMDPF